MKVHEPLVQFTPFHASAFIDLVFRKPWVSSPKKIAELRPDLTLKFFIQALTTSMFFPFIFFVSFLSKVTLHTYWKNSQIQGKYLNKQVTWQKKWHFGDLINFQTS